MNLDDRPAIDQITDPKAPRYCGGCGNELGARHHFTCDVDLLAFEELG